MFFISSLLAFRCSKSYNSLLAVRSAVFCRSFSDVGTRLSSRVGFRLVLELCRGGWRFGKKKSALLAKSIFLDFSQLAEDGEQERNTFGTLTKPIVDREGTLNFIHWMNVGETVVSFCLGKGKRALISE